MPSIVELAPRAARALPTAPSAALIADAGPLAHAVARVWPRPHAPYFAAEPARRRLAGVVAEHAYGDIGALAEPLAHWSLRRIVSAYLPEAPDGLAEAVRKLDGAGWSGAEFRHLIELLGESGGAKVLRHASRIDRELVAILRALPAPLRRTRIIAHVPSRSIADLLARGVKRACGVEEREIRRLADRLDRSRSPHGLFRMLIEVIGLEQLAPPPVPGADWLVPISTVAEIERAALRFENCLKTRIPLLLRGKAAYYEAVGREPAVVEIVRDIQGLWVVGEVRGHANAIISAELWSRIRGHLEAHGARVRGMRPDGLALALAQAAGW
jgi:hypothetical protein